MKIKELTSYLESIAPLQLQESYDNAGLIIGDPERTIKSALATLDVTPGVMEEAIEKKAGLIIAHHPLIFKGLKKLTGSNATERMVIKAVKNNIAVYACHTNLDAITGGVNSFLASLIGLKNPVILKPVENYLLKLVTFIPEDHIETVRNAIFEAGAGVIGNYDQCSFTLNGTGSFRGGSNTDPFIGKKGTINFEKELRLETILPGHLKNKVVQALLNAHPYEEVAYDLYPLENVFPMAGMGMVGNLNKAVSEPDFLNHLKKTLNLHTLRHTSLNNREINKVAVCGGAGSILLNDAIRSGSDAFVSGDFKYHDFFEADDRILMIDVGHYESERYVKEIFSALLKKKFPTFAIRISEVNTNPVNFY